MSTPEVLYDQNGKPVQVRDLLLEARREGAVAVSRTVAEQTLMRALHQAEEQAGPEFVDKWLRSAYKHRCENKP
jgi:hypothetical protein